MLDVDKQRLRKYRPQLVQNIKLNHALYDELRSRDLITEAVQRELESYRTEGEQIGRLLDHLTKGPDWAYATFCLCLINTGQEHIVYDYLEGWLASLLRKLDLESPLRAKILSYLRNTKTQQDVKRVGASLLKSVSDDIQSAKDSALEAVNKHFKKRQKQLTKPLKELKQFYISEVIKISDQIRDDLIQMIHSQVKQRLKKIQQGETMGKWKITANGHKKRGSKTVKKKEE